MNELDFTGLSTEQRERCRLSAPADRGPPDQAWTLSRPLPNSIIGLGLIMSGHCRHSPRRKHRQRALAAVSLGWQIRSFLLQGARPKLTPVVCIHNDGKLFPMSKNVSSSPHMPAIRSSHAE